MLNVVPISLSIYFFLFTKSLTTEIYTLSLHDALPISSAKGRGRTKTRGRSRRDRSGRGRHSECAGRSEEHTSELQSPCNLVCRLLLEKKKVQYLKNKNNENY